MGTNRETLLDQFTTVKAFLRGEAGVHSYDLVPSTCSLCTENIEKRAPAGVQDGLSEMVIFDHLTDSQVFYHNAPVAFGIGPGCLEMVIAPLAIDLQVRLRRTPGSFPSAMRTFLATGYHPLLASQGSLRGAIEARVLDHMALGVREERLESYINADVGMFTRTWSMFSMWLSLAHDQRIPMSINTMHQVSRLRCACNRTMQLDLEEVPQFLGYDKVLLVLMQVTVFAVLPQLERVPAIGLLEPREADTRNVIRFRSEETFEGLGKSIRKHLYGCGGNMFTSMTFESLFQIRLAGEGALVLILLFDHLKHLIIDLARLSQASHEQAGLFLLHVQSVLKCFHVLYYSSLESVCQPFRPPAGGRQFTHMPEGRGPLAAFLVEREFFYVHHYSQPT